MTKLVADKNLERFVKKLKEEFKDHIKEIILFGSRGRGDYTDESDYDFILIFDEVTDELKERIDSLIIDTMLDYGMVITDFVFTREELEKRRYEPFVINARREGIVL